jgi:hypothetical protein
VDAAAARSAADLNGFAPLAGLSRHGREQRRHLHDRFEADMRIAAAARVRYEEIASRVEGLREEQDAYERFETTEGWRRDDLVRVAEELDHHWADVVVASLRAEHPLAFGIGKLRHTRTTLDGDRRVIEAGLPVDRADEWQATRRQLPNVARQRHQAEEQLAAAQPRLRDAGRRRWGRRDHEAVANAQAQVAAGERRVDQAVGVECDLRERFATLTQHQHRRQQHIADISAQLKELDATLAQIVFALDRTRPDRVAALADDPPEYLVARLGPSPRSPGGTAVWCHHALDIEAALDRNNGRIPAWTGWSQQTDRARHRSPWPSGNSKRSGTARRPANGPSSPNKPMLFSTRCAESNGTSPQCVAQADGRKRRRLRGSIPLPNDHSRA